MILDSSALVAIVFQEPGFEIIQTKMFSGEPLGIGAPTLVETAIVLSARLSKDSRGLVERMLKAAEIEVIPFGSLHYEAAVSAWLRYGKGRHPASLNLGDCFSYAVAQLSGQPLLCVGEDFKKTDLRLVPLDQG